MQQPSAPPDFRPARADDCTHLALFADMATRRLTSHLWAMMAAAGQSAFEIGRNIIRNDAAHFTHYRNWRVAEQDSQTVGAFNLYVIAQPAAADAPGPEVTRPLNELKNLAAGNCYIAALAVYPEHQGRGLGKALLQDAENSARAQGHQRLTLMVGSFNEHARQLYVHLGYREWQRRPFIAFAGSDQPGEWILMVKAI